MQKFNLFIDNKWTRPLDGKYFNTCNPATGEVIAEVALASKEDVEGAVKAARQAAPGWAATDGDTRADLMIKAAGIMRRRLKELASWEAKDVGKPISEAINVDIPYALRAMEYFSNQARQIRGNVVPLPGNTAFCYVPYILQPGLYVLQYQPVIP